MSTTDNGAHLHRTTNPAHELSKDVASDFKANLSASVVRSRNMHTYAKAAPAGEGILSTARPAMTDGLSGKLTPESIIKHNGVEMPLRQAERLGLVARDITTGEYRDASLVKTEGEAVPQDQPLDNQKADTESTDQPSDDVSRLAPDDEAEVVDMLNFSADNGVPHGSMVGQYLAGDGSLPESAKAIARKHGINETQLQGQVDRVRDAFAAQVDAHTTALGATWAELAEFEAEHVSVEEARRGRLALVLHGRLDYFTNLAKAYKGSTVPKHHAPALKRREAFDPVSGQKVVLVTINGREMNEKTAARMGLV